MVDENDNNAQGKNSDVPSSDSSMDDENSRMGWYSECYCRVQIPLWSMKTPIVDAASTDIWGSDSSMVDENKEIRVWLKVQGDVQIPLWSMKTMPREAPSSMNISSDSSMVDENQSRQFSNCLR